MWYKRVLHLTGIFIAGTIITVILLCLILFSILLFPPVQNFVLARAHPLFDNVLYGKIKVGSIKSNLISSAKINNIRIYDVNNEKNEVLIDEVIVNFWLPALLLKKININSIKINKISINTLQLKNREFKFPAMPRAESPTDIREKPLFQVQLKRITVDTLEAAYVNEMNDIDLNLHYATTSVDFFKPDSVSVRFAANRIDIRTPWWIGEIDTISTLCVADQEGAQIDSLIVKSPEIYGNLYGFIPFTSEKIWDLYSTLVVRIISDAKGESLLHKYITRGVMDSKLHWGGSITHPVINLKSQINNLKSGKLFVNSISLKSVYADTTFTSDIKMNIGKTEGNIKVQSKIPHLLSNPQLGGYALNISVESEDLISIRKFLPQLKYLRAEDLELFVSGTGYGFNLPTKATLNCSGVTKVKGREYLSAEIKLQNNRWNMLTVWAKNVFSGKGAISDKFYLSGVSKVSINEPELFSRLLLNQDIKGKIESEIEFSGSPPSLELKSVVKGDSLQWKDIMLEKLTGGIAYSKKQFSIENIQGKANGAFDSLFRELKIDSSGGQGSIEFGVTGKIPEIYVTALVQSKDVYYKHLRAKTINSKITLNTLDSIYWNDLTAENGLSRITSNGSCFLKNGLQFMMQGKSELQGSDWKNAGNIEAFAALNKGVIEGRIETDSLDIHAVHQWLALEQTISGKLTSDVQISGRLRNPLVQSKIYFKQPGFNNYTMRDIEGEINVIDSSVNLEGQILLSDTNKHIMLKANIPIHQGNNYTIDTSGDRRRLVSIKSDTFNISELGSFFDQNFIISGLAYFDLSMSGRTSPWILNGKVDLLNGMIRDELHDITISDLNAAVKMQGSTNNPEIKFGIETGNTDVGTETITGTKFNGKFEKNALLIDSGSVSVQNRRALFITGIVPVITTDTDKLQIRYKVDEFPLNFFGAFTPEIIISDGFINGNGFVYYNNGRLQSDGLLNIRNGAIETEIIEQKVGPVNGDILLKGDSILFNNWKGKIEKGAFTVSGNCFVRQNKELGIDLVMRGKNIYLDAPDLLSTQMNDFRIRFVNAEKRNHYVMSGNVNFGQTRFTRDVQIQDIATASKKTGYQSKSILDSIELRLELQFQDNLYVDMNLGDMQLDGNVAISGTAAQPALVGKIDVVQGDILYLDRRFTINKGSVTFVNPLEFNPVLYLEASAEVNTFAQGTTQNITYVINLKVTGDLERPVVTLSSDPPLNEPNIISVLTLGTTLGSVGSDITSRIGSLVGNEILGFGTQRLEQLLGLESITVTGNIFNGQKDENGPLLSLTKRLSDRLTISYETGIGTVNQQKITLLYRLFPFLFFSGQTDNTGNSNVNLRFRLNR